MKILKKLSFESLEVVHTGGLETIKLVNRKHKNEKGITLVALMITIVILLVLAGISIATLTQTGLFEKAKLAKNATENTQTKEKETLDEYGEVIGEIAGNRNEIINGLKYKDLDIKIGDNIFFDFYYQGKKIYPVYWYGFEPSMYVELLSVVTEINKTTSIKKQENSLECISKVSNPDFNYQRQGGFTTSVKINLNKYKKIHIKAEKIEGYWTLKNITKTGNLLEEEWKVIEVKPISVIENTDSIKEYDIDISNITGEWYIGLVSSNESYCKINAIWFE